jgi:hypothetical protein
VSSNLFNRRTSKLEKDPNILFDKLRTIAYSTTYRNYPTFIEITDGEISDLVDETIEFIKAKEQPQGPNNKKEAQAVLQKMEDKINISLPNEIRQQITQEVAPESHIDRKFEEQYPLNKNNQVIDDQVINEPSERKDELINELIMENSNDILECYNEITGENLTIVEKDEITQEELDQIWKDPMQGIVEQQQTDQSWDIIDQQVQEYFQPTIINNEKQSAEQQIPQVSFLRR